MSPDHQDNGSLQGEKREEVTVEAPIHSASRGCDKGLVAAVGGQSPQGSASNDPEASHDDVEGGMLASATPPSPPQHKPSDSPGSTWSAAAIMAGSAFL